MNTLNVCYNLGFNPASWDFTVWMVNVEMARIRHGYDNFSVYFKPGPKDGFRDDTLERPLEQRRMILENVIRPALSLLDATESTVPCSLLYSHMFKDIVRAHKNGEPVPRFRIPQAFKDEAALYLKGRKPLILTLREAGHYSGRNSNLEEWETFAHESGEDVIFVRDTAKADEPLPGFETCPRASRDFLFRGALMEQARCNLLISAGPVGFCWFSTTPYLVFRPLTPHVPHYSPGKPEWWTNHIGIPPGTDCPFAAPHQHIVWEDDTAPVIHAAWGKLRQKAAA